jgi:exonuclease III
MSLLSWNPRGLGPPGTVQELVRLVRTHRPKIVFISETRQRAEKVKKLRWRLGLKHCIIEDGVGKGAGIALFWDEQVEIKVLAKGTRYIDVLIKDDPTGRKWRGTFVYGEPKASERHHMWTLLRRIKPNSADPWLMVGDFNETMWQHEHFSQTKRSERRMAAFRSTLSFCNLFDLGFSGPPWTFDNKQKDRKNVKARIDRAVASVCWTELFAETKVTHICSTRSDHLPLLVEYEKQCQYTKPKEIRYETMWERDPTLSVTIEEAWEGSPPCSNLSDLVKKLNTTRNHMHSWSKETFGSVTKNVNRLRNKIKSLWKKPRSAWREAAIRQATAELDEILHREEMMSRQRSRVTWLQEGDRNTKYFHKKATWRQSKNRIKKLKGLNGRGLMTQGKLIAWPLISSNAYTQKTGEWSLMTS